VAISLTVIESPPKAGVAISKGLLRRFAPRNDSLEVSLRGFPHGKPWQSHYHNGPPSLLSRARPRQGGNFLVEIYRAVSEIPLSF